MTNLDVRHFRAENRVPVDLKKIEFGVLNDLFSAGEAYVKDLEEARDRAKLAAEKEKKEVEAGGMRKRRRKKAGESLRERDSW